MRKNNRMNTLRKIGLLQIVIATVFLLTITRGNYIKKEEKQKSRRIEARIPLGFLLEDLPAFQKESERPAPMDGFFGIFYPSLSYSLSFHETLPVYEDESFLRKGEDVIFGEEDMILGEDSGMEEQAIFENQSNMEIQEPRNAMEDRKKKKGKSAEFREDIYDWKDFVTETKTDPLFQNAKRMVYSKEDFMKYEDLMKTFYVVDPSTYAPQEMMNIETFLAKDMSIDQSGEGPQILIYHTHSQEGFADSVLGDPSTTIVGAGEYLKELLESYGYSVIHETGEYDIDSRSTAYSDIQPVLEQYLSAYPGIQVMIDLHRDEVKEGKLLTVVNGKETAKFMFFNGLSYLNSVGDIAYLNNPYKEDNLAFAFQLQYLTNQYYPDLARKIYLKGYRYNLHYRGKSLLIELGAQTNTREEIWNACEPLAEMIARVLSGEK